MLSRRHLQVGSPLFLTAVLLLASGGCVPGPRSASRSKLPSAGKSPPDSSPATTRPDTMDAAINPADMLAERAQAYSQEMAPAIARRTTVPSGPAQPSQVQWGDTTDTHLSLLPSYLLRPDSAAPPPALAQVETSAASANAQSATLASMKTGAIPNSAAVVAAEQSPREPAVAERAQTHDTPLPSNLPPVDDVSASGAESPNVLDARLAKRVRDYPHDVSAQFDYQLSQFLLDQPVPNLQTVSALPDEDREMISAVMDGLSNYRNNLRADNNMLLTQKVRPLLDMAQRLRSLADLTIPTLALCREVRGFGSYQPFEGDPPHFSAGSDHEVILYCEVQNFSSQLNDSKMWQTELVEDAVLYTEGGMSVWNDKTEAVNDSARNRRQDFFIVQKMKLPRSLPMGRYLLKVTIQDKQSHHVAEATEPLLINAE